ncbi:hypothetical protein [Gracilinema caldarium]|uniref:hypothetical protein n=1 Tax=Gracilinema caldarium TaxID=215591 RepID=UPI00145C5259|nr:hypothetical protein [Gracilinema caldarium]
MWIKADALLSPNLAKSTSWVSLFAKKDQERLRSLIVALDKTRAAMIQDTQNALDALSVYGDKIILLESLLDQYRSDEATFVKAEQWLELPPLSPLEAQKELARLKLLYLTEAKTFADYQYGHRTAGALLSYSKQEEMLLKHGKDLADFLSSRISSLGKSALKPLAVSLASRLQSHPDCPQAISELAALAEKLPTTLYRQWIVMVARGSPAIILPTAFKGLKDTLEGREFEKSLLLYNSFYVQKKQVRALLPLAMNLGMYTDRLAQFSGREDPMPSLNQDFLGQFFSKEIVQYGRLCSTDTMFRRALLEVLSLSWVYVSRPELWQEDRWPFGSLSPETIRNALLQVRDKTGLEHTGKDSDTMLSQVPWNAVLEAETFASKLQKPQELSHLLRLVSEFVLQNEACSLFLESHRYDADRNLLFQKFKTALYQAPSVSSLVPLSFNQAFLLMQWQSKDLLPPEILGLLLQAHKNVVTKELQPWLKTYMLTVGRSRGIPADFLINQNLYGTETNYNLFLLANKSGFRLVHYINRLGLKD